MSDLMTRQRQGGTTKAREHRVAVWGLDADNIAEAFDGVPTAKVQGGEQQRRNLGSPGG